MEDLTEPDIDIQAQSLILAAAHHDLPQLRMLLRSTSANVQDGDTGYTPLHAAIAACTPSDVPVTKLNGATSHINGAEADVEAVQNGEKDEYVLAAEKTLRLLFQNGAIWNDLDANGETPGCLAWRLKLMPLYEIMVDAGVRAELLLGRLDDYEELDGGADEDDDGDEEDTLETEQKTIGETDLDLDNDSAVPNVDIVVDPPADDADAGDDPSVDNNEYLNSQLSISASRILDSANNGVMMDWERDIMRRTSSLLLPKHGLAVLNIGHGMGIIDGLFQDQSPKIHHIIEAHPQVLAQMRERGWMAKPNVVVHEGRWQDVLPRLVEQGDITFDAIYYDTFAEDYKAFRHFFNEYVIALLNSDGKWSFFHGLGADRQVCYDVYTKVAEMDLFEAGFDVEWEIVEVPDLQRNGEWNGVRRSYWKAEKYRLPIWNKWMRNPLALKIYRLAIDENTQTHLTCYTSVDRLGDGKTPFLYPISTFVGGADGQALPAYVSSLVGSLESITITPGHFLPNDLAYKAISNGYFTSLTEALIVPNPISLGQASSPRRSTSFSQPPHLLNPSRTHLPISQQPAAGH